MSAISLIRPYKHHNQWVFDDPRVSLDKEPVIAGANTLINLAIAHLKYFDKLPTNIYAQLKPTS